MIRVWKHNGKWFAACSDPTACCYNCDYVLHDFAARTQTEGSTRAEAIEALARTLRTLADEVEAAEASWAPGQCDTCHAEELVNGLGLCPECSRD